MLHEVLPSIHSKRGFTAVDLKDAYFHIPTCPPYRKYLRFVGKAYEFLMQPSSLTLAIQAFTKCAKPALAMLRGILGWHSCWIELSGSGCGEHNHTALPSPGSQFEDNHRNELTHFHTGCVLRCESEFSVIQNMSIAAENSGVLRTHDTCHLCSGVRYSLTLTLRSHGFHGSCNLWPSTDEHWVLPFQLNSASCAHRGRNVSCMHLDISLLERH